MPESRLVWSSDGGDRRKQRPAARAPVPTGPTDGVVRVSREKAGRKGKTVTLVRGLPRAELTEVASDLKRRCGTGGAVKDGVVEIQGDHRDTVAARLSELGHRVKLAGG